MIVLGLLILLFVAAVVLAAVLRGGDPATLDLQWFEIETDVTGVFLAGAASLLIGVIGLVVLGKGIKRGRRRRVEMHELRDRAKRSEAAREPDSARTSTDQGEAHDHGQHPDTSDDYFDSTPRDHRP